jgi:DNA polymerase
MLTRIIQNVLGLSRNQVYICNVVKCRPPRNRDPEADEIETCRPFLEKQLDIIQPEVICTLGRVANQALIDKNFKISLKRGKWHEYRGIPVMPTFHPAYILRNPTSGRELKMLVWDDMKMIMKRLGLEVKNG